MGGRYAEDKGSKILNRSTRRPLSGVDSSVYRSAARFVIGCLTCEEDGAIYRFGQLLRSVRPSNQRVTVGSARKWIGIPVIGPENFDHTLQLARLHSDMLS